jgi:Uncharacterized protein conserved in bacteria (DUF2125)
MSVAMKEQKPAPRPWRMLFPLFAVLALGLAWSTYWIIASSLAQKAVAERRAALAERGQRLDCSEERWGGFPFRFEFTCADPVLTADAAGTAQAPRLRAVAMAYNPWHLLLLVDGPTRLSRPDGAGLTLNHDGILASLRFRDQTTPPDVSIEIPKLDIVGWYTADDILIHTRPEADGAMGLALTASMSNYQPEGRPPLTVAAGSLLGALRPDGTLSVANIALQDGQTIYKGQGEVRLDAVHRIAGQLATETNDFDGLMRILEPHLDMTPDQFAGLKAMMGLLGQNSKANLIAQDGALYIGPFKVADLLPLY